MNKPIRTDEDARRYLADVGVLGRLQLDGDVVVESAACTRCGGTGNVGTRVAGGVCFRCEGINTMDLRTRTPIKRWAQAHKRRAYRRRKRREFLAREAEFAIGELDKQFPGFREALETDHFVVRDIRNRLTRYGDVSDKQVALVLSIAAEEKRAAEREAARRAGRALSEHVGEVGKRRLFRVVLDAMPHWETAYGTQYCLLLRDPNGNRIVWKTSSPPLVEVPEVGWSRQRGPEHGDVFEFVARVKEHGERDGEKQTVVTRPTKLRVYPVPTSAAA